MHDNGRAILLGLRHGLGASGGGRHSIARLDQVIGDQRNNVRFVIDDEHSLALYGLACHAFRASTLRWILATIISVAIAL